MTTAIQITPRPAIEYPDDDGKPMSENTLQYQWIVTIREGIEGLRKIPRMAGFTSPRLGVRFEPVKGPNNLKIIGRNGEPFITPLEMSRQRTAETKRADAECNRADAECKRADAEHNRAEAYAAKLRELGIEPD